MEKVNAVIVVLDEDFLASAIHKLNFSNINPVAVMTEKADGDAVTFKGRSVARVDFSAVKEILNREPDCLWLIDGSAKSVENIFKVKERLTANGVTAGNIIDIGLTSQINPAWLANLRHIERDGADFFVTGGSYSGLGIRLSCLPHYKWQGINLSGANQTLQQSYQIAEHVFANVKPGTIKYVLIDLSPYSVRYNYSNSFTDNDLKENAPIFEKYFKLCFDNGAKPVGFTFPIDAELRKNYSDKILANFRQTVNDAGKNYKFVFIDLLETKLANGCFYGKSQLTSTGAMRASVLFGSKLYLKDIIPKEEVCGANVNYFKMLTRYFRNDCRGLINHVFCKMAVEDFKRLSKTMPKEDCKDLMVSVFAEQTYDHLANLSNMLPKDDYNDIVARIFEVSAEKLRRKSKITVGVYFDHSSKYFGDDLYNLFHNDERFEPTIFLPIDNNNNNEMIRQEFLRDSAKFKARGFNVVHIKNSTLDVPAQDILFRLRPYKDGIPNAFRLVNVKVTTLIAYIPYSFTVADRSRFLDLPFHRVLWRMFVPSPMFLEMQNKICKVGMPRGIYSGYPKMDVFFKKDVTLDFNWKMTRPDAKKIIWAPHWSIVRGISFSTFHWNYQLMYEFAKAHPEISWVVKPHSYLLVSAVLAKVFPSSEACEEYFRKWDELPNAQFYNGAYYQAIFATSDGMIQDCASFVAEYQYVDKPMIFLTREGEKFNKLGEEILKASYTVEGKDFDAVTAMMQRVFIEGDDYKAAERKKVFDKLLNYPKTNGMLASEFIFKSIADEVTAPT